MLGVHPIHRLRLARHEVNAAARQLEAMHYRNVLRRGFSVTRTAEGAILRSVAEVRPQQPIETELADGRFTSRVDGEARGAAQAATDARPKSPPARRPPSPRRKRRRGPRAGPGDPTLFEL
jgi:exodeoxyribonuclease VII large subunit